MQLLRVRAGDQNEFAAAPEVAMDFHLGRRNPDEFYFVVGCRVAIFLSTDTFIEPNTEFLEASWLNRGLTTEEREGAFRQWLNRLDEAPTLSTATPSQA
jgi:hypothetical protein